MKVTVSTDWVASHIDDLKLSIIDASWYLPTDQRDPLAEYRSEHIPGAQFFDIDAISDRSSDLPHMMPSADEFAAAVGAMGVGNDHTVVVYDGAGIFSAARVWWMFRAFGHDNVFIMDGGLPKWRLERREMREGNEPVAGQGFTAELKSGFVTAAEEILPSGAQVADARPPARFRGEAAEPRAGLLSGHIPGSANVFFKSVLTEDGALKSEAELRSVFEEAGVDLDKPIVTSCGSGVTAAVLDLALTHLGVQDKSLYDGSWSEWGARSDLPIETG